MGIILMLQKEIILKIFQFQNFKTLDGYYSNATDLLGNHLYYRIEEFQNPRWVLF